MSHDFGGVVEHLRSHAGDALQAVVVYRADDHRDLYRREDAAELHGSPLEATILREVRSDVDGHEGQPTGGVDAPPRATVRVFDALVVVHLPRDADSGTVVVLDPAAAQNLTDFVADLRADLYGE